MTLPEVSACLERLGVRLSFSGDKLVADAPLGAVTPEIKTALLIHKPALLALLACGPPPAPPSPVGGQSDQPPRRRGEFNPEDLDENGEFNADKFFARLRRKHGYTIDCGSHKKARNS